MVVRALGEAIQHRYLPPADGRNPDIVKTSRRLIRKRKHKITCEATQERRGDVPATMVIVYTAPHSRGSTAEWFVKELNIPHETKTISIRDKENKSDEYLKVNPFGLIPSIQDGDLTLYESGAICLYLQKKYGGPVTDDEMALITQWAFVSSSTMEFAMAEKNHSKMAEYIKTIDGQIAGRQFLVGERFTAADCLIGGLLAYLNMSMPEVELSKHPEAARYAEEMLNRPANPMKAWAQDKKE